MSEKKLQWRIQPSSSYTNDSGERASLKWTTFPTNVPGKLSFPHLFFVSMDSEDERLHEGDDGLVELDLQDFQKSGELVLEKSSRGKPSLLRRFISKSWFILTLFFVVFLAYCFPWFVSSQNVTKKAWKTRWTIGSTIYS